MNNNRTVIVAGYLVRNTSGGHVLSILHYLAGLRRMGFEVIWVEHFGWAESCFDPTINAMTDDPGFGIAALKSNLQWIGVHRWCYVGADGTYHGMPRQELIQACRSADFLLSLWLVTWLEEFRECRYRIFVDLDPGFTQFALTPDRRVSCDGFASPFDFDIHFSYGTRIGMPDCPIPTHGIQWHPLLPPVAMELIPPVRQTDCRRFTTVMGWNSREPIVYNGEEYGQKDVEFYRIMDLPGTLPEVEFEIVLAGPSAPRERIAAAGWQIADPLTTVHTPAAYLDYIASSGGEFSVAVNLEVKSRSGWFSDRTAAYLASGKPVVVQDTGFSELLPCGDGLFAFATIDDAVEAIRSICSDYPAQCLAARRIAEQHFDAERVLRGMLARCEQLETIV
jgi:hypothetical protein